MARASIRTRLPLDDWAAILGIDPRHFNQVTTSAKVVTSCSTVWKQFAWQENAQVGREDVAEAVQEAERLIEDHVGYLLLPDWTVDERVRVTQAAIPEVINVGFRTTQSYPPTFKGRHGHIVSGGIEGKTLIEAGAAVVYTDEDTDTYPETATITVATTVTDPEEIAVYVPGESGHDGAELRPLNNPFTRRRSVNIAAGVATIVMQRELLVDPDLLTALNPGPVDGNVDANFLATVDVYRHWNDPQQQVTLMWSPRQGDACNCADATCPTCAHSTQVGCLLAHSYRQGIWVVQAGTYDEDDETFSAVSPAVGRVPDHLRAWYYSGLRDQSRDAPNLEMERQWARAVTYLSLTLMTRPLCGCSNIEELSRRMTTDLALTIAQGDGSSSFQLTDRIMNNPWGTMRGAQFAWNLANSMSDRKIGQAVAL